MVLHSPGTVRRYLSALSAAFNRAIKDWQWAGENPCKSIYWPKAPRGRVRFLDDDELPRLRAACRALSVDLADMVDLALLTGMRQGEILGLSWGDVDWGHARLILHETKNGERRQVPLTSQALAILQRRCPAGWTRSMVIFCRRGSPDRPTDLRRTWSRALLDARVADFRFHDLRHTAASYLAMTGATPNQIAEILGHKTLAMVKRYAHLSVENQATVLARLSDRLLPDPD
jgi:integrase